MEQADPFYLCRSIEEHGKPLSVDFGCPSTEAGRSDAAGAGDAITIGEERWSYVPDENVLTEPPKKE